MGCPGDSDLWVVACHFNPAGFLTRRRNALRFLASLEQGSVPYRLIECAFGDTPFELPGGAEVLRVRGLDVMWQKERLLNLGIATLPESCSKVAWIDCDVQFDDPGWAEKTSAALDDAQVVQPFSEVIRLPRPGESPDRGQRIRSLTAVQEEAPDTLRSGEFDAHGHSGYAWAARRTWLDRHGLYDACIAGSADHLMAHAFFGDWRSRCTDEMLGTSGPYRAHFETWAEAMHRDVGGRVGVVEGRIRHLWHGDAAGRRYHRRNQELQAFDFDPSRDIALSPEGVWRWMSVKPRLHRWTRAYFAERDEDGAGRQRWTSSSAARP